MFVLALLLATTATSCGSGGGEEGGPAAFPDPPTLGRSIEERVRADYADSLGIDVDDVATLEVSPEDLPPDVDAWYVEREGTSGHVSGTYLELDGRLFGSPDDDGLDDLLVALGPARLDLGARQLLEVVSSFHFRYGSLDRDGAELSADGDARTLRFTVTTEDDVVERWRLELAADGTTELVQD